ncbi:hypothetical protein OIU77_029764 [Salix suchowensis]|uniref:Uncharacterized protein n=1 Tax=Salix suchowensis TaxID=1278906 RepID=A0ABQ9BA03_9ROSI|nr:hypothetical protein OIU77_029764 [Salix suchowensis]
MWVKLVMKSSTLRFLVGNSIYNKGHRMDCLMLILCFIIPGKTGLEAFDIRFDERAPKVALPQGVMMPVNSFNTIYHSSAFWGLMLPVSVSTMASDVLRGYWGQRLLWEIGGYVVVYPPTVHRYDTVGGYPFSEEKDLHVHVGRLIKFLVAWRSSKHELFEKILELSFAMAEEGFWSEQDVKFTAAWLQDLLAVGYQQPRLMSFELDRPRPSYRSWGSKGVCSSEVAICASWSGGNGDSEL